MGLQGHDDKDGNSDVMRKEAEFFNDFAIFNPDFRDVVTC